MTISTCFYAIFSVVFVGQGDPQQLEICQGDTKTLKQF